MTVVVIPIYDEVTQLDFTALPRFLTMISDIEVTVASIGGASVSSTGLLFDKLANLEAIERCDVLCVPGGLGCVAAMENERFMATVRSLADTATCPTSVCSGSLILGAAGLLKGRRVAIHWAWRDLLRTFGAIPDSSRVVRDGNIITGGGVAAGADFALTLISELHGEDAAQCVQLALEYFAAPPFDAGNADTAPTHIRYMVMSQLGGFMSDARQRIEAIANRRILS